VAATSPRWLADPHAGAGDDTILAGIVGDPTFSEFFNNTSA
jgi:hypothetical protein